MHLLVGDVGGTKTELALFEGRVLCAHQRYASADHLNLDAVLAIFLQAHLPARLQLDAAVLGIAGPVVEQRCQATNLPWQVDGPALSQALRCPVQLINDFVAVAHGVPALGPEQLHVLSPGKRDAAGPMAVIGAGTGLGQALVLPAATGARVFASEGGHCDFSPRTEIEIELLKFLVGRHGHVSVERAVSGPGLVAIYDFLVQSGYATPSSSNANALAEVDLAATISDLGLSKKDSACARALHMFVELYGAEAGNLALKIMPTGGLYVAGGIAPKIVPALAEGAFMKAFLDKGRMRGVLAEIPVAIVTEPRIALLGARHLAEQLVGLQQLSPTVTQSMFEVMGGEPTLRAVVEDFVDRMFADMMIGFFFHKADRVRIKAMEYELAAEALGAPLRYSGRPLRQAHAAHRIMGGQFARRTHLLRETMAAHNLPPGVQAVWLAHTEALRDQITSEPDGTCRD